MKSDLRASGWRKQENGPRGPFPTNGPGGPSSAGTRIAILTGLLIFAGCSRSEKAASHGPITQRATIAAPPALPPSAITASPNPFRFVGETWLDHTGLFAVQDTESHTTAWYRLHDKIGDFEIIGLKGSSLLLQNAARTLLLPLDGAQIIQGIKAPAPAAVPAPPEPPPKITMYVDGKLVAGTPDQLSAEQLKQFNDSREALLKVRDKVSADVAPMVDQALESNNTVVVSNAQDGFKRSDFPPEMAAKLTDETLAKINAAIKSHANPPPTDSTAPKR